MRQARLGMLLALGWWLHAQAASAYCNTTNCRDNSCEPLAPGVVCKHDEHVLAWSDPTIAYAFGAPPQGRIEPTLSDEQVRLMAAESLLTWSDVNCPDGPTPVQFIEIAQTSMARATNFDDGANVIAFLTAQEWRNYPCDDDPSLICPLDEEAFALTDVFFTPSTGQIRGVDMVINGMRGPYTECPEPNGCEVGMGTDLRNVLTHEAGHMLGLSHSSDSEATMFARAVPEEVSKRTLAADDVAGICALYPPGSSDGSPGGGGGGNGGGSSGCNVSPVGDAGRGSADAHGWLSLGLLLGLLLWPARLRARRLHRA